MQWLEWLLRFDWLLGVVVGAMLGFVFGFLGTEIKTCRERSRTRADLAKSLSSEISVNRQVVLAGESNVREGMRLVSPPFERAVLTGCVGDIALLPRNARLTTLSFYGCLDGLETVVQEWRFLEEIQGLDGPTVAYRANYLQDWWLQLAEATVQRADEALGGLEKFTGEGKA